MKYNNKINEYEMFIEKTTKNARRNARHQFDVKKTVTIVISIIAMIKRKKKGKILPTIMITSEIQNHRESIILLLN